MLNGDTVALLNGDPVALLNGDAVALVYSWLLAEKGVQAVCRNYTVKTFKGWKKWTAEFLGVTESESIEVRIRDDGYLKSDFLISPNLDSRCSANYVYYVVPRKFVYGTPPKGAGVLIQTGDARAPFECHVAAQKIHQDKPSVGMTTEISRQTSRELSNVTLQAAELEKTLNRLIARINETHAD